MAITVKHKFVSAIPDGTDATVVRPSNWNDDHDLTGTIPVANGGTGASTAADGLNNLLPSQTGNNGKVLATDGTNATWTTNGSGDVVGPASSTNNAIVRFDSTTGKLIKNSGVTVDDNNNITANALDDAYTNTAASGTLITLTVASPRRYTITGSGGQVIKLPDATTLTNGTVFQFDNNQSSGAITVNNNSNTLVVSVPSGGFVLVNLLSNAIAAGSWDRHDQAPSNVSWSTNTFDYAGSITSATWNGNTVAVNRGGTGQSTYTDGQLLIGNSTGNTLTKSTLTAGTGISVTNSAGAITIANTSPSSGGTVTSVGGTGTVSGISLSGTVTSSGNLTLGGTLDLSSPPAIGGTTPAAGTFTTITGQTEVLKGTGSNLFLQSSSLTNAAWAATNVTLTSGQSDPFGGTTAFLMNTGTGTGNHQIAQILSTPNIFTYSIYAKAGTANYFGIYASAASQGVFFNLTTGAFSANIIGAPTSYSSTNVGGGWWRLSITASVSTAGVQLLISEDGTNYSFTGTSKTVTIVAPQVEVGTTVNTYVPTTTTAIYGTPTLSFSGVAGLGLQSDGSLYVSPAGTGALQAQATTSSTVGGNARGANAVDWQTNRSAAGQVASSTYTVIGGGSGNSATSYASCVSSGVGNLVQGNYNYIGGGAFNTANSSFLNTISTVVGGYLNTGNGFYNFIGGGFTNSGTSASAVTTQSGTMNATTAVTLSGSNASIKVGQYISGTSISGDTYVAAISGTSLTLSKVASGSSTSTLSFYTPHGVVVGGGNNQATGSYSFIGGGGDAGTASQRNTASGAWSAVVGGWNNRATGEAAFVGGGGSYGGGVSGNLASGTSAFVGAGYGNGSSGYSSATVGGAGNSTNNNYAFVGAGSNNTGSGANSAIMGGARGTTRSITGYHVFPACLTPVASSDGVSQSALLILGVETTNATATVLRSDSTAASGTNQVILPNNSAYYFTGEVISGVTGGGDTKGWEIAGVIKRGAGVGTTALVGSTVTSLYADAGAATWTIALAADTTNGGLKVTFTGQASTTIRTVCQIRTTEMTY